MIYWKYAEGSQFILQAWADRADKTLNDFVTDCGKYDLCFGRDSESTEFLQFSVVCWYEVMKNYDAFHCLDGLLRGEFSAVCGFCTFCGVEERYSIQPKLRQHYKGGFEIWKDWDDVKEVK